MTEAINMTYENNVFYCTKNGTKWISIDGEKWYGEEKRIAELENKIADIKANCDLAIEGRDIKIKELELELTVEKDLHQEETNLHLHAEDYIKSLEKENKTLEGCLFAEQEHTQMLEKQIEKMKCCANCEKYFVNCKIEDVTEEEYLRANAFCKHWKLRR